MGSARSMLGPFGRRAVALFALALVACAGCGNGDDGGNATTSYDVVVSEPRFVIPSDSLPDGVEALSSNNNVDIELFDGRLFLAWRTAPNHFASPEARFEIISSTDGGDTWEHEHTIALGADVREPRFFVLDGALQLMFFEAGTNPGAFEPRRMWETRRIAFQQWQALELLTDGGEIPWDVKVRDGVAYRTSYLGEHYGSGETSEISVYFKQSTDGRTWTPVDGREEVYFGGVSETAFEFDDDGAIWIVTRNEDGDATGFGSHLCYAPADALADWDCPQVTDPERYDSPEMFRHEGEIYLVARRDVGGPYDRRDADLTLAQRRARYLIDYSLRPKRTALYRIDRAARRVVHVRDLPGAGDTAFPSVRQTGPHTFLLANYTSPLDDPDISWLRGQTSPRGTRIYLAEIEFVPYSGPTHTPTPSPSATPTPTPGEGEGGARIEVAPVFADPGTALSITWPQGEDVVGILDLGDGAVIDQTVGEHLYAAEEAIYELRAALQSTATSATVNGFVVRSATRATTPLDGVTLVEPSEDVVEQVIRGIMPAFYYGVVGDVLAVAADPSGSDMPRFADVAVANLTLQPGGSFASEPIDLAIELRGLGGEPSGLKVGLRAATWSGASDGAAIRGPLTLRGGIVLDDIAHAAEQLAGLDPADAVEFIAGLFGFDPAMPPESLPFRAELGVE